MRTYGEYTSTTDVEKYLPLHSLQASAPPPEVRTASTSPTKPAPPIARWMGVPAAEGTTAQHRKARADQSLRGDYTTAFQPSTQGGKATRSKPRKSGTAAPLQASIGAEVNTKFVMYLCPYPVSIYVLR